LNVGQVPAGVKKFISDHIGSAEQLDILLYLHSRAGEAYTAGIVGAAVFTVPSAATIRLEQLVASGLVVSDGGSDPLYRYAPQNPAIARAVEELAAVYRSNRVEVIKLVFSAPADPLSSFADAFRLKKDR
jgi:hypothetical protein